MKNQTRGESPLSATPCSQFPFDRASLDLVVAKYGEGNVDEGGEDFCDPWWDSELCCWCVSCRYGDCGLRQYRDGWEYALDGKRWPTALEAYEHRNDKFHSANVKDQMAASEKPRLEKQ